MPTPTPYGTEFVQAVRHYLNENKILHFGKITPASQAAILADIAQRFHDHWLAQQKQRKAKGDATEQELAVYQAYPHKEGRGAALAAIREALRRVDFPVLHAAVRSYGQCVARWPAAYRFKEGRDTCPMPATWFNQERYLDDPRHWLPAGMFTREDDPRGLGQVSPSPTPEPSGWRGHLQAKANAYKQANDGATCDLDYYAKEAWASLPARIREKCVRELNPSP